MARLPLSASQHSIHLVSSEKVKAPQQNSSVTVGPSSEHRRASVKLHKVEEVIKTIEVTCSCGEKTMIELEY